MSYNYFSEQLKGKPKNVSTRIYAVPSEDALKRRPFLQPTLISELIGGDIKSSDITYTENGDVEKKTAYNYVWSKNGKSQIVTEVYEAQFDEHNKIVHSIFKREKERTKNYKTNEKEIEETYTEHNYTNEYDNIGNLVYKIDNSKYIVCIDGEERWNRTYKTLDRFDKTGKLIEEESDYDLVVFSYKKDLIISKKKYYSHEVFNLFEQGKKHEKAYEEKYVYDTRENLISIVKYESTGDIVLLEEMEYDENDKLICRTIKTHDGVARIKYFDKKRVSISKGESYLSAPQKYIRYTIEILDNHSNVIGVYIRQKKMTFKPKKKIWVEEKRDVKEKTFKYTYDAYGNWTRKDYRYNGVNKYIVIREINYFN